MAQKRMLIDALHPEETRVAVLDGNRLEDIDVEAASRRQLKGNIYLAKVTRVEPSLQAAFVDYGGNRHGFLAFNEIHPDYYQIPVADREALVAEYNAGEREDEAKLSADEEAATDEETDEETIVDVETIGGDDSEEVEVRRPISMRRHYKIQEVIKRRQILLVQVVKEERGNKGAAMTTYLSLAGRYCVLMPNTARGGGISRKIPAGKDRKRLKTVLSDLGIPDGMGVIVRTAGAGRSKAEIRRDFEYLVRLWDNVRELTLESIAPVLVYEEGNLIKRSIRDLYSREIDEVIIEGEEGYRTARNFMKLIIPSHVKRVQRYQDEEMPLFHRYQVESQQDAMHSPVVRLKSGGYIVINPTEALVAIDVNSGRSTRERNIEETALRTNIEACEEISRQLRLRDLAGLIVIDLIDMEVSRNRVQVERRLKDAMRNDRARIQLGRISPFGLMEMSRQRLRPSLLETSFETCEHCAGAGVRRSIQSTALHMLRAIEEEGIKRRSREVTFHVPSDIALYLLNHKRETLSSIESRYDVKILLSADDSLIPPDFRIERVKVRSPEDRPEAPVSAESVPGPSPENDDEEKSEEETAKKRRRRRPRRRKRVDEMEMTPTDVTIAEDVVIGPAESDVIEQTASTDEASGEGPEADNGEGGEKPAKRRRRGKRGGRRRRATRETDDLAMAADAEGAGLTQDDSDRSMTEPGSGIGTPDSPTADEGQSGAAVAETVSDAERTTNSRKTEKSDTTPISGEETAETNKPRRQKSEKKPAPKRRRTRKAKSDEAPGEIEAETPSSVKVPAPVAETVAEPAPAVAASEAPGESLAAPEDTGESRAIVINVDSADVKTLRQSPRRGWWRRPTN